MKVAAAGTSFMGDWFEVVRRFRDYGKYRENEKLLVVQRNKLSTEGAL